MNKFNIFIFTLCISLFFCSQVNASYATFNINVTEKMLIKKTRAEDFVTIFYGLVLGSDEQLGLNNENKLAELFFTQELLQKYKKIINLDKKSLEVGCLNDFNNFTGAQESIAGFWIGKIKIEKQKVFVPVYLNLNNNIFDLNKPNIILVLLKTNNGWKIDDISYVQSKISLRSLITSCLNY